MGDIFPNDADGVALRWIVARWELGELSRLSASIPTVGVSSGDPSLRDDKADDDDLSSENLD